MLKIYTTEVPPMEIPFEWFRFPGGEVHFNNDLINKFVGSDNRIIIKTDLVNSDEIMLLLLLAETFSTHDKYLELLYTPYARQDRRTSHGEPFSFKVFAKLINSCGFKKVTIYDPHSDVTPALIENVFVHERLSLVEKIIPSLLMSTRTIIISPDVGAQKANNKISARYNILHIVATKVRNTATGEITGTTVHTDMDLSLMNLVILDDICDGGRTFIELAKKLKEHKPLSINLYTTVGIYSKGIEVLEPHFHSINCFHKLGA